MELVSLAKEALQNGAERAASYKLGQSGLRQLDRVLWVVEKCARWAVPPPLDQDERHQPELVRPLPWVFFLVMLVALRVTRESISLLNLVMGKPPLRSADVVMYVQSKRRYLRTLKYQGTRLMRERPPPAAASWPRALAELLQLAMCVRRPPLCANNNAAAHTDDDRVLVVKRSKRGREDSSPVVSGSETPMERLIEKMMVDLDADSDEDSSFTLTNVTRSKTDRSEVTVESVQGTMDNDTQTTQEQAVKPQERPQATQIDTQHHQVDTSTPQNDTQHHQEDLHTQIELPTTQKRQELPTAQNDIESECQCEDAAISSTSEMKSELEYENPEIDEIPKELFSAPVYPAVISPVDEAQIFLQMEATSKIPRTPNSEQKIANGRTVKSVPSKKKGAHAQEKDRRNSERRPKSMSANNLM